MEIAVVVSDLVVPSTAAGTTDIVGRAIGQALSQRMNASFIVEQRVGGSTISA